MKIGRRSFEIISSIASRWAERRELYLKPVMYVERRPVNELPEGARILSEDEVVEYYNNYTFGTTHSQEM